MKYYDGGCLFATVSVPSDVYVNAEEGPSTSAESSCMFVPQVDPSSPFHSVRLAGGLVIRLEVTRCYTHTHTHLRCVVFKQRNPRLLNPGWLWWVNMTKVMQTHTYTHVEACRYRAVDDVKTLGF